MDVPAQTERSPDSDFEEQVLRQLTACGQSSIRRWAAPASSLIWRWWIPLIRADTCWALSAMARATTAPDPPGTETAFGSRYWRGWDGGFTAFGLRTGSTTRRGITQSVQAIETARTVGPPPAPPAPVLKCWAAGTVPAYRCRSPASEPVGAPYECARVSLRLGNVEMHSVSRTAPGRSSQKGGQRGKPRALDGSGSTHSRRSRHPTLREPDSAGIRRGRTAGRFPWTIQQA